MSFASTVQQLITQEILPAIELIKAKYQQDHCEVLDKEAVSRITIIGGSGWKKYFTIVSNDAKLQVTCIERPNLETMDIHLAYQGGARPQFNLDTTLSYAPDALKKETLVSLVDQKWKALTTSVA